MPDQLADTIRSDLLRWYRRCRRDLPWRAGTPSALAGDTPDPYHVLVSEAMLQQTRVATVVDYFHRFIEAFPTVRDLAAADEQRVLRLWQGLGYYRRARNLHAAAKAIVELHEGEVPDTVEALLGLPGVGPYTAGAIASIAFDRTAAILDGNVARVLARLHGIESPVDDTDTRKQLWQLAEQLAAGPSPGDVNQGLMELGATVCTPRSPQCLVCPLRDHCIANRDGRTEELPQRSPKRPPTAVVHTVLAIRRRKEFLFEQRSDDGLWAGMWQLPTWEVDVDTDEIADLAADRHGLAISPPVELDRFTHQTTHRTITFRVLLADTTAGRLKRGRPARCWRPLDRLDDLPLANPQRRAIEIAQRNLDQT
ncbi:MAG: A/G-specific adenine glycosylase [Phycisphaeraceae bacterium]